MIYSTCYLKLRMSPSRFNLICNCKVDLLQYDCVCVCMWSKVMHVVKGTMQCIDQSAWQESLEQCKAVSYCSLRSQAVSGSLHCPGSMPLAACQQGAGPSLCAHLHPLFCRKLFRTCGRRPRKSVRKKSWASKTPVCGKATAFTEPEPYLVRRLLVDLCSAHATAGALF